MMDQVMAKCEQGYLCAVCGSDVERITDSDLYLRFVVGMIHPELLHVSAERHIRCHPALAQFIVDASFQPPVVVDGPMDKRLMDPEFVRQREALVTRGYRRLHELEQLRPSILEYPLPEIVQKWADGPPIPMKLPKE
jgi:hypothetical protein